MLIGLTGKKRRGKDTVANYLTEKHGFNRHGFADKVKAYAYAQNPIIWMDEDEVDKLAAAISTATKLKMRGDVYFVRLQDLVDTLGWEKAKEIAEVRQLLQRTGTEGGRSIFWKDFWVDILFRELEEKYDTYNDLRIDREGTHIEIKQLQSNIVISDCRFPNEAERIRQYGGIVIKVESEREGLPEPDEHASEQDLPLYLVDGTLHNNGTIEELYEGVEQILDFVGFARKV